MKNFFIFLTILLTIFKIQANDYKNFIINDSNVKISIIKNDSINQEKLQNLNQIIQKKNLAYQIKETAKENLLGGLDLIFYIWWEFWALVGIFLWWGYKVYKGVNKKNIKSPNTFSFLYWIKNNKKRMIIAIWILIFIFILGRFFIDIFKISPTNWMALVIGISLQATIEKFFKKIKNFLPNI